jgi:hypothetical protein
MPPIQVALNIIVFHQVAKKSLSGLGSAPEALSIVVTDHAFEFEHVLSLAASNLSSIASRGAPTDASRLN